MGKSRNFGKVDKSKNESSDQSKFVGGEMGKGRKIRTNQKFCPKCSEKMIGSKK